MSAEPICECDAPRCEREGCQDKPTALMVCPRCEGQRYDVGSCQLCNNSGYVNAQG